MGKNGEERGKERKGKGRKRLRNSGDIRRANEMTAAGPVLLLVQRLKITNIS
jgi:hypothetical protein